MPSATLRRRLMAPAGPLTLAALLPSPSPLQGGQVRGVVECNAARVNGCFDGDFICSQSLHVRTRLGQLVWVSYPIAMSGGGWIPGKSRGRGRGGVGRGQGGHFFASPTRVCSPDYQFTLNVRPSCPHLGSGGCKDEDGSPTPLSRGKGVVVVSFAGSRGQLRPADRVLAGCFVREVLTIVAAWAPGRRFGVTSVTSREAKALSEVGLSRNSRGSTEFIP